MGGVVWFSVVWFGVVWFKCDSGGEMAMEE